MRWRMYIHWDSPKTGWPRLGTVWGYDRYAGLLGEKQMCYEKGHILILCISEGSRAKGRREVSSEKKRGSRVRSHCAL